jgi:hypothetical protein
VIGKEEIFFYPPKGCTLVFALRGQCKNTFDKAVMGVSLARLMRRKLTSDTMVPLILHQSCKYLEAFYQEEGMRVNRGDSLLLLLFPFVFIFLLHWSISFPGIFRKSGNSESIEEYIQRLDYGEELDYADCDDVHNVSR